ncbi:Uncharacterised protein [uncultured archaeon]|nr:Uncharacterised protein [uncultured archaeon]
MKRLNLNKKGLSVVIGYVLLMAISIVMSLLVYQWIKTYVPKEALACSDGTSLFIKSVSYNCDSRILQITLKNNGKFGIDGYFIYASNKEGDELATIDLSSNLQTSSDKEKAIKLSANSIRFVGLENPALENFLLPGNSQANSFSIPAEYGTLKKIEIVPTRIQESDNQKRTVSCSDSKVSEVLTCSTN